MKVVDASAVVALLVRDIDRQQLGNEELAAPHLIDSEVTHVLRRIVQRGHLTAAEGDAAMDGFIDLALSRYSMAELRPRMWALRHNLSGYDASYVALAEQLQATSLLTADAHLANAAGIACVVELL